MGDKGICKKHGEFILIEGCPGCLAEKQGKVFCLSEEGCKHQDGAYCRIKDLDCAFAKAEKQGEPVTITDELIESTATSTPEVIEAKPPVLATIQVNPQADEAVKALYEQSLRAQHFAEARVLTNDEDIKSATNDLSIIKGLMEAFKKARREYTQPINDHLKAVNDAFKTFTEPLLKADQITRGKMLDYHNEQNRIRAEQEDINKKRLEAAQKEMKLKGELTESVNLVEVAPEAPTTIRTNMGTAGVRANWKYEVVDFALLPDEYKLPDTTMLNSIAKKHHDQKQIPGVRFYNEPILAVTTKKEG